MLAEISVSSERSKKSSSAKSYGRKDEQKRSPIDTEKREEETEERTRERGCLEIYIYILYISESQREPQTEIEKIASQKTEIRKAEMRERKGS